MEKRAKTAFKPEGLKVVADRGYCKSEGILTCDKANITVTLPKPQAAKNKARGRFVKPYFRYVKEDNVCISLAGERLVCHSTNQERGLVLRRYWTNI
jgi:hypothetical protein